MNRNEKLNIIIEAFKNVFVELCTKPENMIFELTEDPNEAIIRYKDGSINDIHLYYEFEIYPNVVILYWQILGESTTYSYHVGRKKTMNRNEDYREGRRTVSTLATDLKSVASALDIYAESGETWSSSFRAGYLDGIGRKFEKLIEEARKDIFIIKETENGRPGEDNDCGAEDIGDDTGRREDEEHSEVSE